MAFTKIVPGDIIITNQIGEVYLYLGYYTGTPRSFYYHDRTEGYLYVFLGRNCDQIPKETTDKIMEYIKESNQIEFSDGFMRYLKKPTTYQTLIRHIDLTDHLPDIQNLYHLTRIGNKPPKTR